MKYIKLFSVFALILCILSACIQPRSDSLKDIDSSIVDLESSWEFYWNRFVVSEGDVIPSAEKTVVDLPHTWNSYITDGGSEAGPRGFGSYLKTIEFDSIQYGLAIWMRDAASSYRFFVSADNSEWRLSAIAGDPGKDSESSDSEFRNLFVNLPPAASYTFVFEISNFKIDKGGLWHVPLIAESRILEQYTANILIRDFLLLGALLIAAFYAMFQYILYRESREYLFISIFTLIMALRAFLSGLYIQQWMPGTADFILLFKLDYFTMFAGVPVFALFMQSLFHDHFNPVVMKIIYFLSGVFILMLIFLSPGNVIMFQPLYWILIVSAPLYFAAMLFYYRYHNRDNIALFAAIGILLFLAAILHDILSVREISTWNFIAPYGYLVFILFMVLMTAMQNRDYRRAISSLHSELSLTRSKFINQMRENTTEVKSAADEVKINKNKTRVSEAAEKKVQDSLQFISENFSNKDLNRDTVAHRFELSPSRMGKYFLMCTGIKINDYITEVRLNHSLKLLKDTKMPVIEIAFESGFDNLSTFNRRFRDAFGISPTEFRGSGGEE